MTKRKNIRIGIIGPDDSLHNIEKVAASFSEAEWLYFAYQDVREAPELVARHSNGVDVFVLSGPVPYQLVLNSKMEGKTPMLYIPHTGTALYRTLFELTYHHRKPLQRISIDTLSEEEVADVYQELGVPLSEVYARPLDPADPDPSGWGEYHLDLWKERKIDAVITTLRSTFAWLRDRRVPVFRILPTKSIIRSCLEKAIRIGLLQHAQRGQLLIQLITIDRYGELVHYLGSEYEAQKVQLELYKRLLDYASEIEAAITSIGKESFLLVTTQGVYYRYTEGKLVNPIPEWVLENLPIQISVGIGEGQTGTDAENHARIALEYAKEAGGGCCFFASAAGEISGPLGNDHQISFAYQIEGKMLEIAQQAGMSPATLGKVLHVLEKLQRDELSAAELAQHLKITPRASRRILANLERAGAARRIGEESQSGSGRPRVIYKVMFEA